MCELCKLKEIDKEVVEVLVSIKALPEFGEVDPRIIAAEQRLYNRLRRLQVGLESKFITALRELGYIPSDLNEQEKLIQMIFADFFEELGINVADQGVLAAEIGRQIALEDLIAQGLAISVTSFSEEVAKELRNRIYVFCQDTARRIQDNFVETLTRGYQEGYGINEIAVELRADFRDLRDWQLRRIARTEVQSAQNMGQYETLREHEIEYKQWITAGDSRVRGSRPSDRADHISLHGQVVRIDEPFTNGLMHPGDRNGPLAEFINCRCTMRSYIPRRGELILTTPYYP